MNPMHRLLPTITLACASVLLCLLSACSDSGDTLQQIQSRGVLKVATRNSPTTYYIGRDGANGF